MANNGKGVLGEPEVTGEQIRQAWEHAALEAMEVHRRTGVPVTTWDWESNRIVIVPADEIPISVENSLSGNVTQDERS